MFVRLFVLPCRRNKNKNKKKEGGRQIEAQDGKTVYYSFWSFEKTAILCGEAPKHTVDEIRTYTIDFDNFSQMIKHVFHVVKTVIRHDMQNRQTFVLLASFFPLLACMHGRRTCRATARVSRTTSLHVVKHGKAWQSMLVGLLPATSATRSRIPNLVHGPACKDFFMQVASLQ